MKWADEVRTLGVRTNTDQPDQAASGEGLWQPKASVSAVRSTCFFKATDSSRTRDDPGGRRSRRRRALAKLLPMQKEDFKGYSRHYGWFSRDHPYPGSPITRIPPPDGMKKSLSLAQVMDVPVDRLRDKVKVLQEFNPMLGHRGCRLGISYPGDHRNAGTGDL